MGTNNIFMYMIAGCIAFIAILMFSKPLSQAVRVLVRGAAGALIMLALNFLLSPAGLKIGINLITAAYVGILGLPGMVSLYVIASIL